MKFKTVILGLISGFVVNCFSQQVIVIQPDATSGIDTYLDDDDPSTTHGTSTTLMFKMLNGAESWRNGVSVIRYDLSQLEGKLILGATFYFYESASGAGWHDRGVVYAHRILASNASWTENGASWNYTSGTTRWAGDTGQDGGPDAGCSQSGFDWDAVPTWFS